MTRIFKKVINQDVSKYENVWTVVDDGQSAILIYDGFDGNQHTRTGNTHDNDYYLSCGFIQVQ
jgi:hypothetical protein